VNERSLPATAADGPTPAPAPGAGLLSDIRLYLWNRPAVPTLIAFTSPEQRKACGERILQRLGVSVSAYTVLNLHQIAIDAPSSFVFEELWHREVGAVCWPNEIAELERVDGGIDHVRVHLLGRSAMRLGLRYALRALGLGPLFCLDKLRFQQAPGMLDVDNGRFLLYACSGGYPIGIFGVYVRSSIPGEGESRQSQVFFLVSFDFYGRKSWPGSRLLAAVWEAVHNRVTANMLNRLRQLCEARFRELTRGGAVASDGAAAATVA